MKLLFAYSITELKNRLIEIGYKNLMGERTIEEKKEAKLILMELKRRGVYKNGKGS